MCCFLIRQTGTTLWNLSQSEFMLWSLTVLWHRVSLCCVTVDCVASRPQCCLLGQPGSLRPAARYIFAHEGLLSRRRHLASMPNSFTTTSTPAASLSVSSAWTSCRLWFILRGHIIFPNSSNTWKATALILNIPEDPWTFQDFCHYRSPHTSLVVYFQSMFVFTMHSMLCAQLWCLGLQADLSLTLQGHNNKANVVQIFVMNLIMFTICFLPVSVGLHTIRTTAIKPLICLSAVNCCLYFSLTAFWKKSEDADL